MNAWHNLKVQKLSHSIPERKEIIMPSQVVDFLGGFFGGVVSTYVGHPMDTVKVRLQVNLTLLAFTFVFFKIQYLEDTNL